MANIVVGLSPEIISGRLNREHRSDKMRVSPETIYQWLFADAPVSADFTMNILIERLNGWSIPSKIDIPQCNRNQAKNSKLNYLKSRSFTSHINCIKIPSKTDITILPLIVHY